MFVSAVSTSASLVLIHEACIKEPAVPWLWVARWTVFTLEIWCVSAWARFLALSAPLVQVMHSLPPCGKIPAPLFIITLSMA